MKKISYYFLFLFMLIVSVSAQRGRSLVNSEQKQSKAEAKKPNLYDAIIKGIESKQSKAEAKKIKTDIINLKNGQKIQGTIIKMTEEDLTIVTTNDDGIKTFSVYLQDDIRSFEIFTETKRTVNKGRIISLMGWTFCLCTLTYLWLFLGILGN